MCSFLGYRLTDSLRSKQSEQRACLEVVDFPEKRTVPVASTLLEAFFDQELVNHGSTKIPARKSYAFNLWPSVFVRGKMGSTWGVMYDSVPAAHTEHSTFVVSGGAHSATKLGRYSAQPTNRLSYDPTHHPWDVTEFSRAVYPLIKAGFSNLKVFADPNKDHRLRWQFGRGARRVVKSGQLPNNTPPAPPRQGLIPSPTSITNSVYPKLQVALHKERCPNARVLMLAFSPGNPAGLFSSLRRLDIHGPTGAPWCACPFLRLGVLDKRVGLVWSVPRHCGRPRVHCIRPLLMKVQGRKKAPPPLLKKISNSWATVDRGTTAPLHQPNCKADAWLRNFDTTSRYEGSPPFRRVSRRPRS
ncbi:hypothetical protein B0T13DRAFT_449109 [Neurospora crassa]|nr:hypothetical protein B0T13DRAFT_449109 [Neurospora crassa]